MLWEQVEVGEAGNGRLTRPGGGKGREGKGFQDLCPGLRLPLGITQLRLGSPDHKPPGKWGTEKGEEGGGQNIGTLEEASAISIYKRKAPSSVPPTSTPSNRNGP